MTLQRHRSSLLPEVEYGMDGTVFVTDGDGTFPMRGKGKGRMMPHDYNSFRSLDRNRNELKSKHYSGRFAKEVQNLPATISSANSLGRRLKRSRSSDGGAERYGTVSSSGTAERRIRAGTPKMSAEHAATLTLRRYKKARSHDDRLSTVSDGKVGKRRGSGSDSWKAPPRTGSVGKAGRTLAPLTWNEKKVLALGKPESKAAIMAIPRGRTLAEERLPVSLFLVTGLCLLLLGVANALVSWWHLYYCLLWTGALVLFLGVLGALHRGNYLTKSKNGLYIFVAVVTSGAVVVSTGLVLKVLIALLKGVAMKRPSDDIANNTAFSNMLHSVAGIAVPADSMLYTALAVQLAALLLLLVDHFAWSAAVVALGNHWDAMYTTTGECHHRGHPRFFNPLEQMSVGQATIFIAFVCLFVSFNDEKLYWSPAWAGLVVIFAGLFSMFYGKRIDKNSLGVLAMVMQLLAIGACGVALTFVSIALVDDVNAIYTDRWAMTNHRYRERIASIVVECAYLLMTVVNIVFSVGVTFRIIRGTLCNSCSAPRQDSFT